MTITNNTINNNNISNLGGGSSGSAFANFGVYQQTPVGLSKLAIGTLDLDDICAESYRKVLIPNLFFLQILSLTDHPSVFFTDLLAIVAAYFDIATGCVKIEAKAAA